MLFASTAWSETRTPCRLLLQMTMKIGMRGPKWKVPRVYQDSGLSNNKALCHLRLALESYVFATFFSNKTLMIYYDKISVFGSFWRNLVLFFLSSEAENGSYLVKYWILEYKTYKFLYPHGKRFWTISFSSKFRTDSCGCSLLSMISQHRSKFLNISFQLKSKIISKKEFE